MNTTNENTQGSSLSAETEGLNLPDGIELLEMIGKGRTCVVYKATFQGETVALKLYKEKAAEWYRNKLNKNIAVFEMMQNRTFRKNPDLVTYTAKPIRVIGQDGKHSLCFMQEFVDGITIEELGERYGSIPGYLLRTGETIARICEDQEIPGIDQFMGSAKLRQSGSSWVPMMFDFKHIPSAAPKNNNSGGFLAKLGFGRRKRGPTGFLESWEALYEKLNKEAN